MENLQKEGFVNVAYPQDLRRMVLEAAQSAQAFFALPEEVKKGLPYSNDSDGVGYEFKDGSGNRGDKKENFDVALGSRKWLDKNIGQIGDPVALKFLEDSISLVSAIKPLVVDFAQEVEKYCGIPGFVAEVEEGEDVFFVRFAYYPPQKEAGEEIAVPHIDQGGFTLHLFESDEGLQRLNYENEWVDMPVSDSETVIIPSTQLQLRSEGKLRATAHRVIATEKTAKAGRYSAVCFVQLKNTPKYDKAKYGRLQEMVPGFNYSMPLQEFKKYFKKPDLL